MLVYEVRMFNEDGNVISTYLGAAQSAPDAIRKCVERAVKAGRITLLDGVALTNKARRSNTDSTVNTSQWSFTVETAVSETL